MKIAIFLLVLLAGGYGIWQYRARIIERSEQKLARVLQLDPRKVAPTTRALLLLETIPDLRDAERAVAVKRLRETLQEIPRGLVAHQPRFPVEAIRFSENGSAVMWYGETKDGPRLERWYQRAPGIHPWVPKGSDATFLDDAGMEVFSAEGYDVAADGSRNPSRSKLVMSSDGGYYAQIENGFFSIWSVRDLAGDRPMPRGFQNVVPNATLRMHCVRGADLCGIERRDGFTVVDAKKSRIVRSIAAERNAVVHMSPSGRLVGVAGPRTGFAIHGVRDGRTTKVAAPKLVDFAFSADEKSVVVLDDEGVLHAFDTATGTPRNKSSVLRGEPWTHVETVGDGRFVVWGGEKVRLVSADLASVFARFDEGGAVTMVKTNRHGSRLAIARRDGPLTVWDVAPKMPATSTDDEVLESACAHIGRSLTREEWAAYFPGQRYYARCR